jgi:hypothetical protein
MFSLFFILFIIKNSKNILSSRMSTRKSLTSMVYQDLAGMIPRELSLPVLRFGIISLRHVLYFLHD